MLCRWSACLLAAVECLMRIARDMDPQGYFMVNRYAVRSLCDDRQCIYLIQAKATRATRIDPYSDTPSTYTRAERISPT